jgi:hypothetical protein
MSNLRIGSPYPPYCCKDAGKTFSHLASAEKKESVTEDSGDFCRNPIAQVSNVAGTWAIDSTGVDPRTMPAYREQL